MLSVQLLLSLENSENIQEEFTSEFKLPGELSQCRMSASSAGLWIKIFKKKFKRTDMWPKNIFWFATNRILVQNSNIINTSKYY